VRQIGSSAVFAAAQRENRLGSRFAGFGRQLSGRARIAGLFRRARLVRFVLVFLLAVLISALLSPQILRPAENYRVGQYTTKSVRAPFDFTFIDEEATQAKREQTRASAAPVTDLNVKVPREVQQRITGAFAGMERALLAAEAEAITPDVELRYLSERRKKIALDKQAERARKLVRQAINERLPAFSEEMKIQPSDDDIDDLIDSDFGSEIADGINLLIRKVYEKPVAVDIARLRNEVFGDPEKEPGAGKLLVRNESTGQETLYQNLDAILDANSAGQLLEQGASELLPSFSRDQRRLAAKIASAQVVPNLTYNLAETETRRQAAADSTIEVALQFKKNQYVVREGEEITRERLLALHYLHERWLPKNFAAGMLGTTILLFMLILLGLWIADANVDRFMLTDRDFLFIAVSLVLTVVTFRLWIVVAGQIASRNPNIPPLALLLAFPVGTAAMVTRFVINFEVALVKAAIVAFLLGMMAGEGMQYAIYVFVVGIVAADLIGGCSRRSGVIRAGMWTAVASAAGAACLAALSSPPVTDAAGSIFIAGIAAGLLTGFSVVALSPVVESLFGYTTDITLLELSNYEQPLLKQIMYESPGTFQHSLNIGMLAEKAADAVGANSLLVRVGSLYHDAGKSAVPQFFIENQQGVNPHDELGAEESARIIREHVTRGVSMVRKNKLGERIADFVREHHGTGWIKYFVRRAQEQGLEIKPELYRYPGPRPQSKETGILMIADQVEATSRSMDDKTEPAFREMVLQTVERIRSEGQLDECPLTLQDLALLQEALVEVLTGIHHHRVKYPGQDEKKKSKAEPGDPPSNA
jgi:cyclic-di-AMP phosphodiesterase PgpH